MTDREKVLALVTWIATNSERESIFLTPNPSWSTPTEPLVTKIGELFEISEADLSAACQGS